MPHISEIDPNFAVESKTSRTDARFFDLKRHPEFLFGVQFDEQNFFRMPRALAESIGAGVQSLNLNPSGGRIRFMTDSPYVILQARMPRDYCFSHMPATGVSGFDLYADGVYYATFVPPATVMEGGYERTVEFKGHPRAMREILIHMPLYNYVSEVYIGLADGSLVEVAPAYRHERPVVFYGSSITQGGCVSRPGLAYPSHLSRWLDTDIVNLGFSGNGKGEPSIAEHIASLDPSVFVLDYDHNAPNVEHLRATHEAFFKTFRALRPDTPVIMLSSPDSRFRSSWAGRREVIETTYRNALAAGDQNVAFIDGRTLWGDEDFDSCTVDNCHPNDLGHYRMAKTVAPVLKQYLK